MSVLIFGQHCSRVSLEKQEQEYEIESSSNKFLMSPPTDFKVKHKYIFFIDMSNSMISGPCPQDVNANILFTVFPSYNVYDPNKGVGNKYDHRADGIDCQVNPDLAISWKNITTANPNLQSLPPTFFNTTLGVDFEGHRLTLVRNWIMSVLTTADRETLDSAQVMLIPVSGGVSQRKLNQKLLNITKATSPISFLQLKDPKVLQVLDFLLTEQEKNLELVKNDDPFRYNDTTMGTSSPGSLLKSLYEYLYRDMYEQYKKGALSETEYDFIQLGDGIITPTEKTFEDTLKFSALCSSCATLRQSCVGACSKIVTDMVDSWGDPLDNKLETMEFNFGLIQTLPIYFGAGTIRFNFIKLKKDRSIALWPSEKIFFEELKPLFDAKKRRINIWESANAEAPFKLPGSRSSSISYKITDIFVLNPNVRFNQNGNLDIDSDGDGLFNNEDTELGLNLNISRTNSFCLDGFMKNKAFVERCVDMAKSHSCDPNLDSDGDSLNECEEILLGTDPFDFDSDNDSIPDYFEWLYGFNPLVNDLQKDSNSDGIPNLINFSNGMGPNFSLKQISEDKYVRYDLNNLGKVQISDPLLGPILVDSFQLVLKYVPTLQTSPIDIEEQVPLFSARNLVVTGGQADRKRIDTKDQLISYSNESQMNQIITMARIIDQNDSSRIYWRLYKKNIKIGATLKQPELDLSAFKQIRTMDRN